MKKIYLLMETILKNENGDINAMSSRVIKGPATKSKERMMQNFNSFVSSRKEEFKNTMDSFTFEEKDFENAVGQGHIVHQGHFEVKDKNGDVFYYNSVVLEIDFINE